MIKNGIDITEIKRIKKALEKRADFVERIFTECEVEYIKKKNFRAETVAGMFAAKEAFSKYLGTGFSNITLKDIEIMHDSLEKPYIVFKGKRVAADLSISHSDTAAVASVCGDKSIQNIKKFIPPHKMKALLPLRKPDANKGDFGRIFILGGSKGMTGSVCLSANAALRSGAGLVTVAVPETQRSIAAIKLTEAMTVGCGDAGGDFSGEDSGEILEKINMSDVCAFGMGMGRGAGVDKLAKEIIEASKKTLIVDADGINAVSRNIDILKKLKVNAVFTPHPGEMQRLTGKPPETSEEKRIKTVLEFSEKYNVVTVLKGMRTVISSPDGKYTVNLTGNSGMATGGSGDALSGIIASLIGQGLSAYSAAVLGVYLHGRAGDIAKEELGEHGIIASDLVKKLPLAIKELYY